MNLESMSMVVNLLRNSTSKTKQALSISGYHLQEPMLPGILPTWTPRKEHKQGERGTETAVSLVQEGAPTSLEVIWAYQPWERPHTPSLAPSPVHLWTLIYHSLVNWGPRHSWNISLMSDYPQHWSPCALYFRAEICSQMKSNNPTAMLGLPLLRSPPLAN